MPFETSDILLDSIADSLAEPGYIVLSPAIPGDLTDALYGRAISIKSPEWKNAGIGSGRMHRVDDVVRTDSVHWLDADNPVDAAFLAWMENLRQGLNRRLFLGLLDYESHFAIYAKGDYYKKHVDAFVGRKNRVLTTVLYLNPQWSPEDGGELLIYPPQGDHAIETVLPTYGKLVVFLSERFPHEVVAANRPRYSIAGWFRVNMNC